MDINGVYKELVLSFAVYSMKTMAGDCGKLGVMFVSVVLSFRVLLENISSLRSLHPRKGDSSSLACDGKLVAAISIQPGNCI